MSIADTDIPIPSTASLLDVAYRRQTPDEVRVARAREAGQRIGPCPTCGWPATYEDVTIHRPGHPDVLRTLARCLRRRLGAQCPVETVAEALRPESPLGHLAGSLGALQPVGRVSGRLEEQDALDGLPGGEEEHVPERTCLDCGADIGDRPSRTRRCPACAGERKRHLDVLRHRARSEFLRGLEAQQRQAPPPESLRISVLELAQRAAEGAGARATMRAVLALSTERQDLLRRLLEDMEVSE